MGKETYICAQCGEEFEKTWSDDDARAEKNKHWPKVPLEHCSMVCDDCYKLMVQ